MPQEIVRTIRIETQRSENSINSLNKEIKDLKKALGDLTIGTEEYIRVQTELADKQSRLKEINSSLKAEARTTVRRLETMQRSASGLASAYSALNAAMALSGKAGANFEKTLTKIQSGIAIAQGLGGLKDFIQEIPNLIDDFKNLGNVVASFFGKFNKSLDPLDSRLSKTAEKLTGLKVPEAGKGSVNASASAGSGNKVIVQQTQALAQQQKTIVPLNEQWNKYNEQLKTAISYASDWTDDFKKLKDIFTEYNKTAVPEARVNIDKLNKAGQDLISGNIKPMRDFFNELNLDSDALAAVARKMGVSFNNLSRSLSTFEDNLKEDSDYLDELKSKLNEVESAGGKASTGLSKVGGIIKSVFSTVSWTVLISFLVSAVYELIN